MNFIQEIEALIFTSEQSITPEEIQTCLSSFHEETFKKEDILSMIEEIRQKYGSEDYAFELVEIAGGFQFMTKIAYRDVIALQLQQKSKKKLSAAAMETLAIIAYKQPITKAEVEHIRGVNCDYSIQKLLEKDLIEISGKSEGPGKPVLYSTSKSFMDYFAINSTRDLPQLKDIYVQQQNEIGQQIE
jgi:segregation and condensation protein B